MNEIIRSVKGTRDFYPEEMAQRQWLIGKMRDASTAFGFTQYDGPCLESIELYAAKSGEELVREQAFVFPDRGGDPITLRPELTPTLARMVAQKQNELVFPLRWWSFGPFWRYERPQKGRTREFFQWNVDLIGSDSVLADAELIAVAATFLRMVSIQPQDVQLLVNDRQLMDQAMTSAGVPADKKGEMLRLIDRLDKLPADVWDEKVLGLGLSLSQLDSVKALLQNKHLWQESSNLRQLFEVVESLGVHEYVTYDPRIIRGLDYYTGTVFEARDTKGEFRAILGGGHYGNLIGDVGGKPLPGVGFAMGDVVISLVLEAYGLLKDELSNTGTVFVTVFNEEMLAQSLQLASKLRAEGLQVVTQTEPEKLAKQLKFADRLGYKAAIVMGPDEESQGMAQVKNLRTREQELVTLNALAEKLKQMIS
ncbi:MAG TPA: histidine--tRNA ligase [Anaerolineaceae bacterium]|nr:histidine--tRNA ligase [Anaerolineaceae bacterium]HPT23784.1 histidine--tRNA ligase [Anaerolineaceae bacterium]